jgi:hypothetical protein
MVHPSSRILLLLFLLVVAAGACGSRHDDGGGREAFGSGDDGGTPESGADGPLVGASGLYSTHLVVQAEDWPGAPYLPSGTRSNAPVTFGVPLPDAIGVPGTLGSSPSQLALKDASGAALPSQFRVLGHWNSGNAKWVLIDAQLPSFIEGQEAEMDLVQVPAGGGNTPSTSMGTQCTGTGTPIAACTDAHHIVVNTGAATFSLKESNYNLFDDVRVGTTHLVSAASHGPQDGLALLGPRDGLSLPHSVSCPNGPPPTPDTGAQPCDNLYTSNLDPTSTCSFDDNGPLRSTVKCAGNLVDGAGQVYLHFTTRTTFWAHHSDVKLQVVLRNADATLASNSFASAYKEFTSFAARVTTSLASGLRTVTFGTAEGPKTVTVSAPSDQAYLYAGYENFLNYGDFENVAPCASVSDASRCSYSPIRITSNGPPRVYGQNGYQVALNGAVQASGTSAQVPPGWFDEVDAAGNGVESGVYQAAAYWPKSLEVGAGGAEIGVGLWPDQSLFLPAPNAVQSYAQWWPGWSIHDLYFNFHTGSLASPEEPFLEFQSALVGRAARVDAYDLARDGETGMSAMLFGLPDPAAEDSYLANLGIVCSAGNLGQCLSDVGLGAKAAPQMAMFRFWETPSSGGGNQHEFALGMLRNWLQRGLVGRYVMARHWYRFLAETGVPHTDTPGGFRALCTPGKSCSPSLSPWGYPEAIHPTNVTFEDWLDAANSMEHAHIYGEIDWYNLTGDETIKEHILAAYKDLTLNRNVPFNNPAYSSVPNTNAVISTRAVGHKLRLHARFSIFLRDIDDPDEDTTTHATVLAPADNLFAYAIQPPLILSGYPAGAVDAPGCDAATPDEVGACVQGTSPVRGIPWILNVDNCGTSGGSPPCDAVSHRVVKPFQNGILAPGLYEYLEAFINARGHGQWQELNGQRFDDRTIRGFLYAVGVSTYAENFNDAPGVNSSMADGINYDGFIDYLNSTPPCTEGSCSHTCTMGCDSWTTWFNLFAIGAATGTTADLDGTPWQAAFDVQMRKVGPEMANAIEPSEWMSDIAEAAIDIAISHNPSLPSSPTTGSGVPVLTKVPIRVNPTTCAAPSTGTMTCTLTWTPPARLSVVDGETYELRYGACKTGSADCPAGGMAISGWLRFHPNCSTTSATNECTAGTGSLVHSPCSGGFDARNGSGCWEASSDPRSHMNWFEAVPVPDGQQNTAAITSTATSYTFTASAGATYTFDLRAWVPQ